MTGTNFTNASFRFPTMDEFTVLSGTNFTRADLGLGHYNDTDLRGATFVDADMHRSSFNRANASGVNFTRADFFRNEFTDTDLTGAILVDVLLERVIWVNTICPDGTNSDDNGNTCEGHLVP